MDILAKIVEHKRVEVAERKRLVPTDMLEEKIYFKGPTVSLAQYLARPNASGIIAEIKRRSPSKGEFKACLDVEAVSISYMQHGASALSVLTDSHFFGGAHADLEKARYYNLCPILCKDFILDEYQITEARAYGADVILLIAAILDDDKIMRFIDLSHRLNMEVLVEVHTENELDRVIDFKWDHLGINARDLRDFSVSIDRAIKLGNMVNNLRSRIAESGIHGPADLIKLREAGFNGFLIGELFMKANDPGRALGQLINNGQNVAC